MTDPNLEKNEHIVKIQSVFRGILTRQKIKEKMGFESQFRFRAYVHAALAHMGPLKLKAEDMLPFEGM